MIDYSMIYTMVVKAIRVVKRLRGESTVRPGVFDRMRGDEIRGA